MRLIYDVLIGGVDHSIPGNGGDECMNYLPTWQKLLETIVLVPLSMYGIFWCIGQLEFPTKIPIKSEDIKIPCIQKSNGAVGGHNEKPDNEPDASEDHKTEPQANGKIDGQPNDSETQSEDNEHPANGKSNGKVDEATDVPNLPPCPHTPEVKPLREYLFKIYLVVFIVELIYKMISKTGIFLLNPCHVTTVLQLILLRVKENSPWSTQFFRFHMYTMPGAIIAILFPILNTRLLIGEVVIYYIQHFFIVFVPLFLMLHGESFVPESANNLAWPLFSFCIILLYHYVVLQPLAWLTYVNLNCIMCPAVSDPFASRFYRLAGIFHQGIITPVITKLYSWLGLWLVADTKQHVIESSMHVAKKIS